MLALGGGLWSANAADVSKPAASPPNIVLILADDLGYSDVSCFGGEVPTPAIDSLARDGAKFTSFYTSSTCTPSRYALLTGTYPNRSRDQLLAPLDYLDRRDDARGLRAGVPTVADRLRAAGYATSLVGKWHVGFGQPEFRPRQHGFERFFGYSAGAIDYFTSRYGKFPDLWRNDALEDVPGYAPDVLTMEAAGQIERFARESRPFFLYLAQVAPHFGKPWNALEQKAYNAMQPKPETLARFESIRDPVRRHYAAIVADLDAAVGRVLRAIREAGLENDTLVVFLSDNGGVPHLGATNRPFAGQKGTLFEGGIRVPCLMRWPGHILPGAVVDTPAHFVDWMPTLLQLAGAGAPPVPADGIPLFPLQEFTARPARALFWDEVAAERDGGGELQAMRHGDWKYLRLKSGEERLFNLKDDPAEQHNLSAMEPGRLASLRTEFAVWRQSIYGPVAPVH